MDAPTSASPESTATGVASPPNNDLPTVTRNGDSARLTLVGEIDLAWMTEHELFMADFYRSCPPSVILDVGDVTFVDSTGLSLVVGCIKATDAQGGSVVVVNPSPLFAQILGVSGLDKFVTTEVVANRVE